MTDEKDAKALISPADRADADAIADEEFEELFGAFDDVSASDSLKAATLEFITRASEGEQCAANSDAEARRTGEGAPVGAVRKSGASSQRRAKLRVIRVAALAACLVLALTGGVAYATPASHITVTQGETAIDLDVNCFGITVSATSDGEDGQAIVDENELRNLSYKDALARTLDALYSTRPDEPVEVTVDAGEGAQRERIQGESDAVMEEHAPDQRRDNRDVAAPPERGSDAQPDGDRPHEGTPAANPPQSAPSGPSANGDSTGQEPNPQDSGSQPGPTSPQR